jgi:hypothetical protein
MNEQSASGAESLTVTFELPWAEQVRASRVLTHGLRSTWLAYGLFGFMSLAALVVWVAAGPSFPLHLALLGVGGPLFVMAIIYLSPSFAVWETRRQMPTHQGPHTWTLSRTGLAIASPHTTRSLEWCLVMEVRQVREFWLFRITKGAAYVLPRRVLDEPTEASLRTHLQDWVGARVAMGRRPS